MSRSKTQESLQKPKSVGVFGDLRIRCSSSQCHEKTVAEISMKDFLDFLKISYQVNEAIENPALDITEKGSVDWKKLTSDTLINRLKEREALISKGLIKSESKEDSSNEQKSTEQPTEVPTQNPTQQNSEDRLIDKKGTENLSSNSLTSSQSLESKLVPSKTNQKKTKKEGVNDTETSRSLESLGERTPARQIKKKLNDVLQEGILDSVLPYLLPKHQNATQDSAQITIKKQPSTHEGKKNGGSTEKLEKWSLGTVAKEKSESRRKFLNNNFSDKNEEKDPDVVIHVCDEIKNLKKDFRCSQKLLLSQMGYFAEVTTGQKLEDMDISVHCDVTIFEWLIKWIQKDTLSREHWPALDSSIVIPVLMSSAFLQMNSLQEFCLQYCKNHMNEVIVNSPNLGCLNDNILTRLTNLFSNTEVENIVDKKDKIQSKLFCKLIVSLTEPEPQTERGHYSSLASIYRCSVCLKLILKNMSNSTFCVANNMKMDRNGTIHSTHVYDLSWNLTDYVRNLKTVLKSWRKVYWRLWADCHLLFCEVCEEYFPVSQMSWCSVHVEPVQYFPIDNQRTVFHSIGRYPCCREATYRFEVVKKSSGCEFRNHVINPKTPNEIEILRMWNLHKDVIQISPPSKPQVEKIKLLKTTAENGTIKKYPAYWWEGLELVPTKQPSGLLHKVWDAVIRKDESKPAIVSSENKIQKPLAPKTSTVQQTPIQELSSFSDSSDESCCSSNAGNSEESYHSGSKVMSKSKNSITSTTYYASHRLPFVRKEKKRRKKKKKKGFASKNEGNQFWGSKLSTRCNQDNQREFEERALKQIESVLAKKLSGENFRPSGNRNNYHVVPSGGIYVKLEQEWREAHCFTHGCPGSSIKARGSASHLNLNSTNLSARKRSKSKSHR